jgi:hypothetical protein
MVSRERETRALGCACAHQQTPPPAPRGQAGHARAPAAVDDLLDLRR